MPPDQSQPDPQQPVRDPKGRFLPGQNACGRQHQWKPGQSGNPQGRVSAHKLSRQLVAALNANDGALVNALIQVALTRALKGDFRFFKEIWDRLEGKVPDRIAGVDGETLKTYINVDVARVCRKQRPDSNS